MSFKPTFIRNDNTALDYRWLEPLRIQSKRVHELMCLMAIIIFPIFAFFDKYTLPDEVYWPLTTIRLTITGIIFVWLIIQKKFNTPEIYLSYFAFCSISWFCGLASVLGGAEFLYQHNIAYCTVFLAASLFILWPWYHSLILVLSSIFVYVILTTYFQLFTIQLALLDGGAVLLTLMGLHPVVVYFRYQSYKREFKLKIALEDSNELLVKSKNEADEWNSGLLMAREELNDANAELIAVNQNLENLVKARTENLEETNLKLQKALSELDRFLYSSYHDIKGPIARMRGLANLLVSKSNSPEQILEFNSHFTKTLAEMEELIEKLNRVNSLNQRDPEITKIDSLTLFNKVKNKYPEANIIIENNKGLEFESDIDLLSMVLDCLIVNSLKYNKNPLDLQISLDAHKSLFGIEFEVKDNGDGIPQNQLDKIFLMFYRAHVNSKGHGLGLYLAKKALEKLSGTIKAESEEGKYSLFTFYLPSKI